MFFGKTKTIKPSTLENVLIYAIGDIHGSLDLLIAMRQKIIKDAENYPANRKVVIYVGDYIDRGLKSKEVIDLLINQPLTGFEQIFLKGNHEAALLNFLKNPLESASWLFWGGEMTLSSYGVPIRDKNNQKINPEELSENLSKNLPEAHKDFLNSLKLSHSEGDYLFVHAGINPSRSIAKQDDEDLLTIRDKFIFSPKKLEKIVVFGHTIFNEPFYQNGKIGIDTGAYFYGKLSAVRIWQNDINFITVSRNAQITN